VKWLTVTDSVRVTESVTVNLTQVVEYDKLHLSTKTAHADKLKFVGRSSTARVHSPGGLE